MLPEYVTCGVSLYNWFELLIIPYYIGIGSILLCFGVFVQLLRFLALGVSGVGLDVEADA